MSGGLMRNPLRFREGSSLPWGTQQTKQGPFPCMSVAWAFWSLECLH